MEFKSKDAAHTFSDAVKDWLKGAATAASDTQKETQDVSPEKTDNIKKPKGSPISTSS